MSSSASASAILSRDIQSNYALHPPRDAAETRAKVTEFVIKANAAICKDFRDPVVQLAPILFSDIRALFESIKSCGSSLTKNHLFQALIVTMKEDVTRLEAFKERTADVVALWSKLSNQLHMLRPNASEFGLEADYSTLTDRVIALGERFNLSGENSGSSFSSARVTGLAKRAMNACLETIHSAPLPLKAFILFCIYNSGYTKLSILGTLGVAAGYFLREAPKQDLLPPPGFIKAHAPKSQPGTVRGTLGDDAFLHEGKSRKAPSVVFQAVSFLGKFLDPAIDVLSAETIDTSQKLALRGYQALASVGRFAEKVRTHSFITVENLLIDPKNAVFEGIELKSARKPACYQTLFREMSAERTKTCVLVTANESSYALSFDPVRQLYGVYNPIESTFHAFPSPEAAARFIESLCPFAAAAIHKARVALPIDPVSLDEIPVDRQIKFCGNIYEITNYTNVLISDWKKQNAFKDYEGRTISAADFTQIVTQITNYYSLSILELFRALVEPSPFRRNYNEICRAMSSEGTDGERLNLLFTLPLDTLYGSRTRAIRFLKAVKQSARCPEDRKTALINTMSPDVVNAVYPLAEVLPVAPPVHARGPGRPPMRPAAVLAVGGMHARLLGMGHGHGPAHAPAPVRGRAAPLILRAPDPFENLRAMEQNAMLVHDLFEQAFGYRD